MQRLKYLVAWEIDAELTSVPSDIVDLPGLFYVSLPSEAYLPTGIGRMISLRTLGVIDLSKNSTGNVMSLGKLTNLQDLRLTCSTLQPDNLERNLECLGSIILKLRNLKCVTLVPAVSSDVNIQDDASASSMSISWHGFSIAPLPPPLVGRLELSRRCCILSSLPEWTKELTKLCILKIAVRKVASEDIIVLKGLPSLTALSLFVWTVPVRRIMFDSEGFLVLKYFKFVCAAPCLGFLDRAMTSVRILKLGFNSDRLERYSLVDAGFDKLTSLTKISTKVGGPDADEYKRSTKSVLTDAISRHPGNPVIHVKWVDLNFSGDDEKYTEAQKERWNQTLERDDVAQEVSSDKNGIQEKGDVKKQADMRTYTPLESTSYMQTTGDASGKREKPYTGTGRVEQASDRTKTSEVADATQKMAAGEAIESGPEEDNVIAHNVHATEIEEVLDVLDPKKEAKQEEQYLEDKDNHQMENWDEARVYSEEQYAKGKQKTATHGEQESKCEGLTGEEDDDGAELVIQRVSMKNGISTEDLKLPLIEKHTAGISEKLHSIDEYGDACKNRLENKSHHTSWTSTKSSNIMSRKSITSTNTRLGLLSRTTQRSSYECKVVGGTSRFKLPSIPTFGARETSGGTSSTQMLEDAWKTRTTTGIYSPLGSSSYPSAYAPRRREQGPGNPLEGRIYERWQYARAPMYAWSAAPMQPSNTSMPTHRAAEMQTPERTAYGQRTPSRSRMRQRSQSHPVIHEEEVAVPPEANRTENYLVSLGRVRADKSSSDSSSRQQSSGNRSQEISVRQASSCCIL